MRDNRTCVTHSGQLEGETFDFANEQVQLLEYDEDEDLLQNFEGIPKQSIIEKLD